MTGVERRLAERRALAAVAEAKDDRAKVLAALTDQVLSRAEITALSNVQGWRLGLALRRLTRRRLIVRCYGRFYSLPGNRLWRSVNDRLVNPQEGG